MKQAKILLATIALVSVAIAKPTYNELLEENIKLIEENTQLKKELKKYAQSDEQQEGYTVDDIKKGGIWIFEKSKDLANDAYEGGKKIYEENVK
jgi:regulator of replication initiation timing